MKHCFYHLLCRNDYISIHNRIFAKILSNPFFDDAQFYFSVVGDDILNNRLLMPRIPPIYDMVKDVGSELPAFEMMDKYRDRIGDDDLIFYFHCKGSSKGSLKDVPNHEQEIYQGSLNYQDTLRSKFAINDWTDYLSFFLIERVQEYEEYLREYGTICIYPPRHLFGNEAFAGSLGNFWWCTGNICRALSKCDYKTSNRHYFEVVALGEMIKASDNKYRTGYYIHDGALHTYTPDSPTVTQLIDGYWNKRFTNLINMDMPYDINNLSIVVRDRDNTGTNKFNEEQRFKNYAIVPHAITPPRALVYISMHDVGIVRPWWWLDNFAKTIKNTHVLNKTMAIEGCEVTYEYDA